VPMTSNSTIQRREPAAFMARLFTLSFSDASPEEEAHRREAPRLARLALAVARPTPLRGDEKSAEAAAIAEFKIGQERHRLIVRADDE
jgi:hypothetical protein